MEKSVANINQIMDGIEPVDRKWVEKARARTAQLVMPTRALGRLHDLSEQICGIQETLEPAIDRKAVLIMAGDHGVAADGVSAYPQEVTGAMVQTFLAGGAGINAISRHVNADVWVVDMGIIPEIDAQAMPGSDRLIVRKVRPGTDSFLRGPAMTRQEAEASVVEGFQQAAKLFEEGLDVLGTGDMGIGNTTPSAAIGAVVTGADLDVMVGRGTGVDDEGLLQKREVIQKGIAVNKPDKGDGLDVLAKVGGFEIGGIAGSILAAAYYHRPVVVDGFISTAGALIAASLCPQAKAYLIAGHCSEESGHRTMLGHLGLKPVLDLGMRLGEGTGSALAMSIIEGSLKMFKEVLTFEEAGVPDAQ
ncbi:MAG: nicotinate-nucleotide--dimethylbenzimidazole phosphoribosyltransferase [Thermodesulfobacteriota bacterium]